MITVDTTQKAMIQLDEGSTVLDLIQALTENLGGEWDNAVLRPFVPAGNIFGGPRSGPWGIEVVLTESAPARAETWESEDGEHVAKPNPDGTRTCSCYCASNLTDDQMVAHMEAMVGSKWREDSPA